MQVPVPDRQPISAPGIAQRLAEAIDRIGSRAAVAKRIGVSPSTLHEYVHGGEIKLSTLLKIAEVCRVSVGWLILGRAEDGAPGQPPPPQGSSRQAGFSVMEGHPAPPRATHIDPDVLVSALAIVDAIAATSDPPMSMRARARRIAIAYDQLTLPESELDPLPPLPSAERF